MRDQTSLPLEVTRRSEGLFSSGKGENEVESAAKSVYLEQEFATTGILFEPLKDRKKGFLYASFLWCEGDDEEVIAMFSTHRVIIRGVRLGHLPEQFTGQRVRRVCVMGRADTILAEADGKVAAVTDIKIDRLSDEGQPEE